MISEIIIANTAEAFETILSSVGSRAERLRRIRHEHALSDRGLLWGSRNKAVVLPRRPPQALVEQMRRTVGLGIEVLWPACCGLSLCDAVSTDHGLLKRLTRLIRENPGIQVTAYAVTPHFAALLSKLRARGLTFESNCSEAADTVATTQYLDSKAGFRTEMTILARRTPVVRIPRGEVCSDVADALRMVDWFLTRNCSCVVKANQGEAGWGLHFVKASARRSPRGLLREAQTALVSDSIWLSRPLVVEEWIRASSHRGAQSPSAECYVDNAGAHVTYLCDQLVDRHGSFGGVILGRGFPEEKTRLQIERAAKAIGRHFFKLGARGFFDIDFVLDANGRAIAVETNVRRTGGTHVFDLKSALGPDFSQHFFLAEDSFQFGKVALRPAEVFRRLNGMLFSRKARAGVVVTLLPRRVGQLGYVLVAPNYKKLLSLRSQMRAALQ